MKKHDKEVLQSRLDAEEKELKRLKAIYNKDFRFAGLINIESEIPRTSGTWRIIKLSHSLDANLPSSGKWESSITAFYPHMSGAVGKFV